MNGTAQGVMYEQAATALLVQTWYAVDPPVLHLFVSDSTPGVGDRPFADYREAFGPTYAPLPIGQSYLELLSPSPLTYGVVGAEFPNVGPLSPGDDTVFGWWIDQPTTSSPLSLFGGRFSTPIVLNMAGQSLNFDVIELPLHDCGVSIPLQSITLLDFFEDTGSVTATLHKPLLGPTYNALQGAWSCFNREMQLTGIGTHGFAVVMTNAATANGYLRADWIPGTKDGGIAFRGSDSANFWTFGPRQISGIIEVFKIVNNNPISKATHSYTSNAAVTLRLEVVLNDDTLTFYTEGGNSFQLTGDTFNSTATMAGFFGTATGGAAGRSIIFTPAQP